MRRTVESVADAISLGARVSVRGKDIHAQSGSMLSLSFPLRPDHQALLQTHELAAVEEIMPYHNIRLSPMPALEMSACSRALEASCPRGASVT